MAKTSKLEQIFHKLDQERLQDMYAHQSDTFKLIYEAEMSKLIFDENPFLKLIPKEKPVKSK